MKFYGVSGINGLGKTNGVEKTPDFVFGNLKIEGNVFSLRLDSYLEDSKKIFSLVDFSSFERNFFLGGDHSVSYVLCKAFFEKKKNAKLLVFDAHPDLMNPMKEPTHEEWLRKLIDEDLIRPKNVLIVGVRRNSENVDSSELDYAKERGIRIVFSDEFERRKKEIFDFISQGCFYFSFDVDVFDSSVFSATGYPEEGGLNEKEIFGFLDEISEKKNLMCFDLVEYNSVLDKGEKDFRIVKKILNLFSD